MTQPGAGAEKREILPELVRAALLAREEARAGEHARPEWFEGLTLQEEWDAKVSQLTTTEEREAYNAQVRILERKEKK